MNSFRLVVEIIVFSILLSPTLSFRSLKNGRYAWRLLTVGSRTQQQQQEHNCKNNLCLTTRNGPKFGDFVTFFTELSLSKNHHSDDSYENRRLLSSRYYQNYAKDIENTSRYNDDDDLMQQQVMSFLFKEKYNYNIFRNYDLEPDILDSYVDNPYQSSPSYDKSYEDYTSSFDDEEDYDDEDEYCGIDDRDCDTECIIPDEYKEYSKNHNNIDVLSYLGIRRANPLQPPEDI